MLAITDRLNTFKEKLIGEGFDASWSDETSKPNTYEFDLEKGGVGHVVSLTLASHPAPGVVGRLVERFTGSATPGPMRYELQTFDLSGQPVKFDINTDKQWAAFEQFVRDEHKERRISVPGRVLASRAEGLHA